MKTNGDWKCFRNLNGPEEEEIRAFFSSKGSALIVSHEHPDGDAIGSALGLAITLISLGHEVSVYLPDGAPDSLRWLPYYDSVKTFEKDHESFPGFKDPDICFFLDFSSLDRLGEMQEEILKLGSKTILIDHHPKLDPFADISVVCERRGSTAEIVYCFLDYFNLKDDINSDAATCLMTGIITDTLGFRVSSSYPDIYQVVQVLVKQGARIEEIYESIYNQYSYERLKLLGYCLSEKLVYLPQYQTAYISLSRKEQNDFRHAKGDTEGFVNYPLSIKGINFSVLFTEQSNHIKLSLRSKGNIAANEIAQKYYAGGGHKFAAGGKSFLGLSETLEEFEKQLPEICKKYNK